MQTTKACRRFHDSVHANQNRCTSIFHTLVNLCEEHQSFPRWYGKTLPWWSLIYRSDYDTDSARKRIKTCESDAGLPKCFQCAIQTWNAAVVWGALVKNTTVLLFAAASGSRSAAPQLTSVMLVSFIVGGIGNWIFNWRHAVERSDVMQVQQHRHHPRHHPGLGSSLRDAVQKPAGTIYVCSGPVWGQTSGVYRCAAAASAPETVLRRIEVPLQQLFLMLHADVTEPQPLASTQAAA